jgi:hypothetical protein
VFLNVLSGRAGPEDAAVTLLELVRLTCSDMNVVDLVRLQHIYKVLYLLSRIFGYVEQRLP